MRIKQLSAILTIVYAYISSGYAQTNDCGLERFQCHNGECIAGELLCDGKANCKDSSDETQAECLKPEILCPHYAFRCKYGACVNGDAVCNGVQDCVDNSDETQPQCTRTSENHNQTKSQRRSVQCKVDQFLCDNGQCISQFDVCDGNKNCVDGSDEVSARCGSLICSPTVFRCAYGACIDGDLRCNEVIDCADGSDEDPRLCGGTGWAVQPGTTTERSPVQPSSSTVSPGIKTCKTPPQPQNGHWKLPRSQCSNTRQDCDISQGVDLRPGSYLIYSCDEGYQIRDLITSTDVICNVEGKWVNIPVCTEISCKALSSASIRTECTYNGDWVSCDSPVLPRTRARLFCRDSYQPESNQVLSTRRDFVTCNANGQWEPEPIRCTPVCGIPSSNVKPLIVHSNRDQPNITEFPWHATMYREVSHDKPKEFFCGASIIQENLLITAAHCIYDETNSQVMDPRKIYIATGNIFRDYDYPSPYVKNNQVKHIYTTCNYLGLTGNYIRDIAILELVEPFVLSATLVPVCIDLFSDRRVLEAGAVGKVAGFGITAGGKPSAILQTLTVPYISFSECKSASQNVNTQKFLTTDKFCAGYTNGSSVCDGDSGGGLVFQTNDLWYLRGIVSVSLSTIQEGGSFRCNNNLYSLYTQISSHIDWIQNVIQIVKFQGNQPYMENVCKK